jgi:hypothetical protein
MASLATETEKSMLGFLHFFALALIENGDRFGLDRLTVSPGVNHLQHCRHQWPGCNSLVRPVAAGSLKDAVRQARIQQLWRPVRIICLRSHEPSFEA